MIKKIKILINKIKSIYQILWIWWHTSRKIDKIAIMGFSIIILLILIIPIECHVHVGKKKEPIVSDYHKAHDLNKTHKKKILIHHPPKESFINKAKWGGAGFNYTLQRECGDCKELCSSVKHDKGGETCGGFSYRDNSDLFAKIINSEFQRCRHRGIYSPAGNTDPFGLVKDTCYLMREAYWERYIRFFEDCSWEAICMLGDISILQGPTTAIKLFQRSAGIKEDGIFGDQSKRHCIKGSFDIESLHDTRLAAIKTYKDFNYFKNGWLSRLEKTYKFCKNKTTYLKAETKNGKYISKI